MGSQLSMCALVVTASKTTTVATVVGNGMSYLPAVLAKYSITSLTSDVGPVPLVGNRQEPELQRTASHAN